jgi:multidrug efflux pump subunit AcrA (membrane-fusion protein)
MLDTIPKETFPMALSAPRIRNRATAHLPRQLAALGLALMLALAITYVAVLGNPFARSQTTPTYQTAQVSQGTVQVTVSATGPITTAASVPLTFKSSGKLAEVDVSVG